jgi:tetratricopeptide (TPR) repeat protein
MHDLLHGYAARRAQLDETPEDNREVASRGLAWYARTAQRADRVAFPLLPGMPDVVDAVGVELSFADRLEALTWLRAERANLIAVVHRAADDGLPELALAMVTSTRFLGYRERALSALHVEVLSVGAAVALDMGDEPMLALLLLSRADTLRYLDRLAEAESDFVRGLAMGEDLADTYLVFSGLAGLGRMRMRQDRLHEAREYYQRALSPSQAIGVSWTEAVVHYNLGEICRRLGDFAQALEHAERELVLRRRAGDQAGEAGALCNAALCWQGLGDYQVAVDLCSQAVERYRTLGDISHDMVIALLALADSQEHGGDAAGAAVSLGEVLAALVQLGDPRVEQTQERLAALESNITQRPDS